MADLRKKVENYKSPLETLRLHQQLNASSLQTERSVTPGIENPMPLLQKQRNYSTKNKFGMRSTQRHHVDPHWKQSFIVSNMTPKYKYLDRETPMLSTENLIPKTQSMLESERSLGLL